jgi:hypothetical protein
LALLSGNGAFTYVSDTALSDRYAIVQAAHHGDALKLLAFWEARPPDGIVMGRDVPSRSMACLLSSIMILEPVQDGSDMRVRLAGASLEKRFGYDVKGRLMSEMFPLEEFRDHLKDALSVIETGKAVIIDSRLSAGAVEKLHLEVVQFPIFATDRKSKWVLTGTFYFA